MSRSGRTSNPSSGNQSELPSWLRSATRSTRPSDVVRARSASGRCRSRRRECGGVESAVLRLDARADPNPRRFALCAALSARSSDGACSSIAGLTSRWRRNRRLASPRLASAMPPSSTRSSRSTTSNRRRTSARAAASPLEGAPTKRQHGRTSTMSFSASRNPPATCCGMSLTWLAAAMARTWRASTGWKTPVRVSPAR